jgi:rhodanese-related sulfurtransferase
VVKKLVETQANAVIIDSRPKRPKYDKGHITGAISLPDSAFDDMTGDLPGDKSVPLVFYCEGYT